MGPEQNVEDNVRVNGAQCHEGQTSTGVHGVGDVHYDVPPPQDDDLQKANDSVGEKSVIDKATTPSNVPGCGPFEVHQSTPDALVNDAPVLNISGLGIFINDEHVADLYGNYYMLLQDDTFIQRHLPPYQQAYIDGQPVLAQKEDVLPQKPPILTENEAVSPQKHPGLPQKEPLLPQIHPVLPQTDQVLPEK